MKEIKKIYYDSVVGSEYEITSFLDESNDNYTDFRIVSIVYVDGYAYRNCDNTYRNDTFALFFSFTEKKTKEK